MAKKFIPNTAASGAETPFDNIVGLQTVQGGGLTQGNFEFDLGLSEKTNRTFVDYVVKYVLSRQFLVSIHRNYPGLGRNHQHYCNLRPNFQFGQHQNDIHFKRPGRKCNLMGHGCKCKQHSQIG